MRPLRKQASDLRVENAALTELHQRFKDQAKLQEAKLISKAEELAEKVKLLEEKAAKDAQEAESALKSANVLAEAREKRINTLEADLEQTQKDLEYERAAREEMEDALQDCVDKLETAKDSLKENEKTLEDWRPDIYQKGYDLCRSQVLGGADASTLPDAVEPPPGWWGDSRSCLPDQPFIDVGADPDSESSESEEEGENSQAAVPEAPVEVIPPRTSSTVNPAALVSQTPEGYVEDVTAHEISEA